MTTTLPATSWQERITNRTVPLAAISPHPDNPRIHPEQQLVALEDSHKEFSQYRSVVVWERPGGAFWQVAGHGIDEAMRRRGVADVRADVLPEDTPSTIITRIMLADNGLPRLAEDDTDILTRLLQAEQEAGRVLSTLGYDQAALDEMLADLEEAAERDARDGAPGAGGDDFEEDIDEIEVRCAVGELWQMGKHRLLVGDCTDLGNVRRLMGGELSCVCWTDPPYGVSYVGKTKKALTFKNDGKEDIDAFLKRAFAALDTTLADGAAIYVAHPAGTLSLTFGLRFIGQGWHLHQTLIWVKDSMVLGHSDYHYRHEPIYLGYKTGQGRHGRGTDAWYGDNSQTTVFEVDRPKASERHPTSKPLDLIIPMISNSSPPGGLVYDPFLGSGSTLIAGERTGRKVFGFELDVKYATYILDRWEAESGRKAVRLSGGDAPQEDAHGEEVTSHAHAS